MNLKKMFPDASQSTIAANARLQDAKSQCYEKAALGATVQGKAKSLSRVTVRFIGYRSRPLDPDNFAAGCKDLLDGLRHAFLISGDEPWNINFETRQEKVSHRSEEKTVIELEYPKQTRAESPADARPKLAKP